MECSVADHTDHFLADWKGEAGSRRTQWAKSPARASIRAGGAESADIPRSDRERAEGFHLAITSAVAGAGLSATVTSTPCT